MDKALESVQTVVLPYAVRHGCSVHAPIIRAHAGGCRGALLRFVMRLL